MSGICRCWGSLSALLVASGLFSIYQRGMNTHQVSIVLTKAEGGSVAISHQ